jgi:hypothetical protein
VVTPLGQASYGLSQGNSFVAPQPPPASRSATPGDQSTASPALALCAQLPKTILTEAETLVLMRLCVENRVEYDEGPKKDFWDLIRDRLRTITGHDFKNVRQKVGLLVRNRLDVLARETTGRERTRSELSIAIDSWIDVLNDEKRRIEASRREKELRREEAAEAHRTRDNLLRSR